jgi:tetratricopeptide (TPR) repeat protein
MFPHSKAPVDSHREGHDGVPAPATARALACVEAALSSLHGARGDVHAHLDEALRHDPACVGAHCLRAAALLLAAEHVADPALAPVLAALGRLHAKATDRERRHAAAARAWFAGDLRAALAHYGDLLNDDPHDSLALHLAHALDFRLGQREMLRDRIAQVLPRWNHGMRDFAHVLVMYAFGLEENGEFAQAESVARRSLELAPGNPAAVHVVAHVMEMQGRAREGIAWLEATRRHWADNPGFAVHIAWHLALFHIDRNDVNAALAAYDRMLAPSQASSMAALVDASALLWRLHLRDLPLQARWRRLGTCWKRKRLRGARAFNLVHAVAAFAAAGKSRLARRVIAWLAHDVSTRAANEPADLDLAIPVCEAMDAFVRGAYSTTIERIGAVRAIAARCGGSVAQCDLIHLTLIEAALRNRSMRLAQALAAERAARKPESLLNRWLFARSRIRISKQPVSMAFHLRRERIA